MIQITYFQKRILEYLINQDEFTKTKDIAYYFEVSERKIRYDIEYLFGMYADKTLIERNKQKEIRVNKSIALDLIKKSEIVFSQQERRLTILVYVYSGRIVKINDIIVQFNISRQTAYQDIKKLSQLLELHELKLKYDSNNGYQLDSNEIDIRKKLLELLRNGDIRRHFYEELNPNYVISEYLEQFRHIQKRMILKEIYDILPIVIEVTKLRSKYGFKLVSNETRTDARRVFEITASLFHFENVNDIYFIIDSVIAFSRDKDSHPEDDYSEQVSLIINDLYKIFNINFQNEEKISPMLRLHIYETLHRIQRKEYVRNELKEEIITGFPLTYALTHEVLTKHLGESVRNDEIAFIAMYMKSILDKDRIFENVIKVAVICNFGHSTSSLLLKRLQNHFGNDYFEGPYSLKEYYEIKDMTNFDVIVTTVSIPDKNSLFINPLLPAEDVAKLEKVIQKIIYERQCEHIVKTYKKQKMSDVDYRLKDLIKPTHIQDNDDIKDWKKAIHHAAEPLLKDGIISSKYIDKMIWSVTAFGTYMVILPKIAFVHASSEDGVFRQGISLLKLKEDIEFGAHSSDKVKVIIVIASTTKEDLGLLRLVNILEDTETSEILFNANSKEELLEI